MSLLRKRRVDEAVIEYSAAMEMFPDNAEMVFWPAVTLASTGRVEESLPLFKKVFAWTRIGQLFSLVCPRSASSPRTKR